MEETIVLKIYRSDPARGHEGGYQEFKIAAGEGRTVLALLQDIYHHQDATLAFRNHHCHLGICQACLVKVNGLKVRACVKTLYPGNTAVVEPARAGNILRDLACAL